MMALLYAHPLDPARPYKLAQELGRAVSRGLIPDAIARSELVRSAVTAAPDHPALPAFCSRLAWTMRDSAREHTA